MNVHTGVLGRLTLPDEDGTMKELFLGCGDDLSSTPGLIHVPLYYWKVLHDPDRKEAVAFVGLNNPHVEKAPATLCENKYCKFAIPHKQNMIFQTCSLLKYEMSFQVFLR